MLNVILDYFSAPLTAVVLGVIAGQLGLIALWSVLGPGRVRTRLPATLLIVVLLCGMLLFGTAISAGSNAVASILRTIVFWPLALLTVGLPVWIFSLASGCHIVAIRGEATASPYGKRQFGVAHLMLAMAIVAVALTGARAALSWKDMAAVEWFGIGETCLVYSAWSAFSAVPVLWIKSTSRTNIAGAIMLAVYTSFMTPLPIGVIAVISQGGGPIFGVTLVAMLLNLSLVFTLYGSLIVIHRNGYVFSWSRRKSRLAAETEDRDDRDTDTLPPLE